MRLVAKAFLAFSLVLVSHSAHAQAMTLIAYLPFSVSTYVPVGRDSIKDSAFVTISLKHSSIPSEILGLIKEGSVTPMNEGTIRLLISDGKSVYYFDQRGNGVRDSKSPVSINPLEFERLVSQERISLSIPGPRRF